MAKDKDKKKEKPKRGCMARLGFAVSAVSSLLLAGALVIMLLPQDIWNIEGYGEGAQSQQARDLTAVLRESVERGQLLLTDGDFMTPLHRRVARVGGAGS